MSCNESLPPYQDPRNVLQGVPRGKYVLSYFENSLHVSFTIKNVYEETFQAEATFEGTLVITAKRSPAIQKTVHLAAQNITYAANYNKATRVLTLDPVDSVVLSFTWNFVDDAGQDLRVMFFRYLPDTSCLGRYIASEETFLLQGSVNVYEKVPEVSGGPIEYTFCHINAYLSPHECLTPHREPPCGFR
jgi:hypothetical protein